MSHEPHVVSAGNTALTAAKLAEVAEIVSVAEARHVPLAQIPSTLPVLAQPRQCEACAKELPPTEAYFCRKCFFTLPGNLRVKFVRFWKLNSRKPDLMRPMIDKLVAHLKSL